MIRDNEFFPDALLSSRAYQRAFVNYLRLQPESTVEQGSSSKDLQEDTISERNSVTATSIDDTFHTAVANQHDDMDGEQIHSFALRRITNDMSHLMHDNSDEIPSRPHGHPPLTLFLDEGGSAQERELQQEEQNVRVMRNLLKQKVQQLSEVVPLDPSGWGDRLERIRASDLAAATETMNDPQILAVMHRDYDFHSSTKRRIGRLRTDLKSITEKFISLRPLDDDFRNLRATLEGPPSSPYRGGIFHLHLRIPDKYPFRPPSCSFLTRIYHPNISPEGKICIDLLESRNWRPIYGLWALLLSIISILDDPTIEDPLVPEIAATYIQDRDQYEHNARKFTQDYATISQDMPEYGITPFAS
jgi:ubiquitin-protein ligase